jgi:hypothetical protein
MRLWTVHEPRKPASAAERADRTIFVKDGFSWPGLIFPLPWLLFQRLWLGTLVYVALAFAAGGIGLFMTEDSGFLLACLANLYVALEGNDMRRRKLARQGFAEMGSVMAKSPDEAEQIFFAERGTPDVTAPEPPRPKAPTLPRGSGHDVIGLFPNPENVR